MTNLVIKREIFNQKLWTIYEALSIVLRDEVRGWGSALLLATIKLAKINFWADY